MRCTYGDCRKLYGLGNFADFSAAGVAWLEEHAITSNDYMAALPAAGPPFLPRTYGFDLRMLLVDFMHSDVLGVGGWLLANALLDMAKGRAFWRLCWYSQVAIRASFVNCVRIVCEVCQG